MAGPEPIGRDPTVLAPGTDTGDAGGERLKEGAVAGDYVVDRHIGAGAMGDVYAGHHPVIGKRVAIKVTKRALADRSEAATRFLREARAVNHVDHPGVVDVFAIGRLDDGRLFLVMDLLDGQSLRERLRAGPVPTTVAMRILGEVAAALDAAHAKGVIHRDLKPDNVMLTGPDDAPTAHVLDFGIARLVAESGGAPTQETLTGQGTWLGTPAYMAPEQWSADGATVASDRYALGVMAYELVSGRPPFVGGSVVAMMEQHFRAAVPTVTGAGGRRLPAAVDRVLARALAKEPGDRYPSGAALVTALEAALREAPGLARAPVGRGAWIAGAAAGAVVVAGVVVIATSQGKDRARPAAAAVSEPPAGDALVEIATTPPGARVIIGGNDRGATPLVLPATPGRELTIDLVRPGYVTARRVVTVKAGEPMAVNVALALVSGFEGVWSLPDGAGLRAFERRGEQVAGFQLKTPAAAREFLRFFEFVPATSGIAFAAAEPFVDERAPEEPSCNIPLRAEYRYDPDGDRLELRRERAQYTLVAGRCELTATTWSEPRELARIAGAPADAVWAESRAGAGSVNAATNGAEPANIDAPGNVDAPANGEKPSKPTPGKPTKKVPTATKVPPGKVPPGKGAQDLGKQPPPAASLPPSGGLDNDDDVGAAMRKGTPASNGKDEAQAVQGAGIDRGFTPAPVPQQAAPQPPPVPQQAAPQPPPVAQKSAPQQAPPELSQQAAPSPQAPVKPGAKRK